MEALDHARGHAAPDPPAPPAAGGAAEIGLLEKDQRHDLGQGLFALTVGGLSQRKVVGRIQRFVGGTLSVATIHAVLDWLAARAETTAAYQPRFPRLWPRGWERIELLVSDGAEAIASAAEMVYPAAEHQLRLAHWFRNREALTPALRFEQRRKFRRQFWCWWEAWEETE